VPITKNSQINNGPENRVRILQPVIVFLKIYFKKYYFLKNKLFYDI